MDAGYWHLEGLRRAFAREDERVLAEPCKQDVVLGQRDVVDRVSGRRVPVTPCAASPAKVENDFIFVVYKPAM